MSRELLAWLVFGIETAAFLWFCWYVFRNSQTRPGRDITISPCICGRKAPSIRMSRGRTTGVGFLMIYVTLVILPAGTIGQSYTPDVVDASWLGIFVVIGYWVTGIVPLVKFAYWVHTIPCALRRGLLSLGGFYHQSN